MQQLTDDWLHVSVSGRGGGLTSAAAVNKTDGAERQKELPFIFETGRLMEGSRTLNEWMEAKRSGFLKRFKAQRSGINKWFS